MAGSALTVGIGDRVELEVTELVAGGDALARLDGLPVFVRDLVPGDVALVEILESRRGFARGRAIEVLRPSPLRRADPCPARDACGGCDWTTLRLDAQLRAKRHILLESLRRVGKLDVASLPPVRIHPSALNYRLRSRLHVDHSAGASPSIGFFARGSHRVVPLPPECEVVGRRTLTAIPRLADSMARGITEVQFFETGDEARTVTRRDTAPQIHVRVPVRRAATRTDFEYRLSPESFFQVNRHLLGTLLSLVMCHAERCHDRSAALDLYAGVGFFTAPLASLFGQVTAIEESPESRTWAELNTSAFPGVEVIGGRVEEQLQADSPAVPFVFADPPRAGLHPAVVGAIGRIATEAICYLSCDPVTFSRDAARLARSGWRISSLDLVDLFPNTHHVETLCALTREP